MRAKRPIPDCLVVGGGVMGMMIARHLAIEGMRVVLLDQEQTGRESSWAAGGILSPLYPWRYSDSINLLVQWSQREYVRLASELQSATGLDVQWCRSGLIVLDSDDAEQSLVWGHRLDICLERVSPGEFQHQEPNLAPQSRSVIRLPDVAQIRPPRLLQALRSSLHQYGVEVREQTVVTDIHYKTGQVRGVGTSRGHEDADLIIVACGAWSGKLLQGVGYSVPVRPVRGQMLYLNAPEGLLHGILLEHEKYLIPRIGGGMVVGSTLEDAGFDKSITHEARKDLLRSAERILPSIWQYPVEHQWAGLRPDAFRENPILCRHPELDNLFICTGHFRNGIAMAPASARQICDLILNRPPLFDPLPYQL